MRRHSQPSPKNFLSGLARARNSLKSDFLETEGTRPSITATVDLPINHGKGDRFERVEMEANEGKFSPSRRNHSKRLSFPSREMRSLVALTSSYVPSFKCIYTNFSLYLTIHPLSCRICLPDALSALFEDVPDRIIHRHQTERFSRQITFFLSPRFAPLWVICTSPFRSNSRIALSSIRTKRRTRLFPTMFVTGPCRKNKKCVVVEHRFEIQ